MPPTLDPMYAFHEDRIVKLEENADNAHAAAARIDAKMEDLVARVSEGFASTHLKLNKIDEICAALEKVSSVDVRVKSLEKTRLSMKKWGWKLCLPVCILLMGSAAGVHGPKLIHLIVEIFGG